MTRLPVMGVNVTAVELPDAVDRLIQVASQSTGFGVSALAVHGLVMASRDQELRHRINSIEMVVPDGQPVRWALNWLHNAGLKDRVPGPELMLRTCQEAARRSLPIFLFGSSSETLNDLEISLKRRFPELVVAGTQPSRFRAATQAEAESDITRIRKSGARIVFVGLGCPRQEIWAFENRHRLQLPVVAVGAAFDFHAGKLRRAPDWMSRAGLEWLYRLSQEPGRLWRRYADTNPAFILGVARQRLGHQHDVEGKTPRVPVRPG